MYRRGRCLLILRRYYEGGVSSVYFWDLDDGFAGVVLLKKSMLFYSSFFIHNAWGDARALTCL